MRHLNATKHRATAAKCFVQNMPVDVQLISAHQKEIDAKKVLASIISTVIFCGTHDLPLRGEGQHEGVFEDLIKLKIGSGDQIMKEHIESGAKNATYTSPRIQTEIIDLCGDVIRDDIVAEGHMPIVSWQTRAAMYLEKSNFPLTSDFLMKKRWWFVKNF